MLISFHTVYLKVTVAISHAVFMKLLSVPQAFYAEQCYDSINGNKQSLKEALTMTQNTNSKRNSIFSALYRNRIIVSKGNAVPVNLPILIAILLLLFVPWLTVTGVVVALALGCRLAIEKSSTEFDGSFHAMVKNTAEDIKNTVANIG
jgi:hypothetical protein